MDGMKNEASLRQVFIVGTGRCGSTLLSGMLRTHPAVTSVSEFFAFVTDLGGRIAQTFAAELDGRVEGAQIWERISTAWPRQNLMLRHDVAMDEVIYPWRGGHRFDASTGVPAVSQVTLPHLSDDPDTLFDALGAFVCALPRDTVGNQFRAVFKWLCARERTGGWAERSGGGLRILRRLREHFPDARFVHIVRDGRDTAMSMSRHFGFRMVLVAFQLMETLGVDPFESDLRTWEEDLPDDLASLLPERFTREAFLSFETPTALCGHYWSGEMMDGLAVLDALPKGDLLTLRFEDFLSAPGPTARALSEFLCEGATDDAWLARATALVGTARSSWRRLPDREQRELLAACRPGFEALAARGFTWADSL